MFREKFISNSFFKGAILFVAPFFLFSTISFAAISESTNYKLHTGASDSGGSSAVSSSYSGINTAGYPMGTDVLKSASYKVYSGLMPTLNRIPDVEVASYNDGLLTYDDTPTLKWSFSDKDKDPQRYYQVQISKDNFKNMIVDSGLIKSSELKFTAPILPTEETYINYKWRVRVSDGYDYSGWQEAQSGFKLSGTDMEMPIVWAKIPTTGEDIPPSAWQDCEKPYLYWEYPVTNADIVGYSFSWEGLPDDTVDTQDTYYQTPDGFLSDGRKVFYVKAQNTAGGWSEVASFEVWVDKTEPSLGDPSSYEGVVMSTDTPTISIDVNDINSGVNPSSIIMKVNKRNVNATYDDESKKIIFVPNVPLSEGDNIISLEVSDYVGNKTTPLVWSFTVDTGLPAGLVIINNNDPVTNSIYVKLDLNADDSISNINSMCLSNDGIFDTESWESFKSKKDWILNPVNGTRKVYAKFKDAAGNESKISIDTIELLIIAPETYITSGPESITNSLDVLFTFTSSMYGSLFRWKFDNEEWSDWMMDNSVSKKDLGEGNHYFKVQSAKDINNNNEIDPDEIDPLPEERTWTITSEEILAPERSKKRPFKYWREE